MYCRNCGTKIDEDVKFCPNCGENLQSTAQEPSTSTGTPEVVEDKPAKVWTIFSQVGKILGIVCLATSLIPYINYISLEFAIAGIVFSCLGRKAKTEETDKNCSLGLKLSIAAVVVSFVMAVLYTVLLELGIITFFDQSYFNYYY